MEVTKDFAISEFEAQKFDRWTMYDPSGKFRIAEGDGREAVGNLIRMLDNIQADRVLLKCFNGISTTHAKRRAKISGEDASGDITKDNTPRAVWLVRLSESKPHAQPMNGFTTIQPDSKSMEEIRKLHEQIAELKLQNVQAQFQQQIADLRRELKEAKENDGSEKWITLAMSLMQPKETAAIQEQPKQPVQQATTDRGKLLQAAYTNDPEFDQLMQAIVKMQEEHPDNYYQYANMLKQMK